MKKLLICILMLLIMMSNFQIINVIKAEEEVTVVFDGNGAQGIIYLDFGFAPPYK